MCRPPSTSRRGSPCSRRARSPATVAPDQAERISIESDADVVTARQRSRALSVGFDMPRTDQTLLAPALSEMARYITTYAARGEAPIDLVRASNGPRGHRAQA